MAPGRPIQPKDSDRHLGRRPRRLRRRLSQEALGAIVLEMESTYQIVDNPVIASPTFVGGASLPETRVASGVFPTRQVEITDLDRPAGRRQHPCRGHRSVRRRNQEATTRHRRRHGGLLRGPGPSPIAVRRSSPTWMRPLSAPSSPSSSPPTDASGVDRVYLLVAEESGRYFARRCLDDLARARPRAGSGRPVAGPDPSTSPRAPSGRVRRPGKGHARQCWLREQQGNATSPSRSSRLRRLLRLRRRLS